MELPLYSQPEVTSVLYSQDLCCSFQKHLDFFEYFEDGVKSVGLHDFKFICFLPNAQNKNP